MACATPDFEAGGLVLERYLLATGYARCTWNEARTRLEVATGGWSGCEEILNSIHLTLWHARYWESDHRGGWVVFTSEDI